MQNKPNLGDNSMNISFCLTKHYKQKTPLRPTSKQSQSNPIKPNFTIDFEPELGSHVAKRRARNGSLKSLNLMPEEGLEPSPCCQDGILNPLHNSQKALQTKGLAKSNHTTCPPAWTNPCKNSPELEQIISVWPSLPEHIKQAIKALVEIHIKEKK